VLVATQPGSGWEEGRLHSWSNSIGALGVVHSIGLWHAVLAFTIGLMLGISLDIDPRPPLERVMRQRIPAGRDHAKGVGPPIPRTRMTGLAQETTNRGARLLVAHLHSLDPKAVPARQRLDGSLGIELARKLVFALGPRSAERKAA
jgi:hypothetical protein